MVVVEKKALFVVKGGSISSLNYPPEALFEQADFWYLR